MTDPRDNLGFDESADRVPDALVDDLRRLHESGFGVPPAVDRAVLVSAAEQLAAGRRRQRLVYRLTATAAAAAILLVFVFVDSFRSYERSPGAPGVVVMREDLDRSGRVDILDAFLLARRLESPGPVDPQWDMNGDGVVDDHDVDVVAMTAVRLPTG